MWTSKQKSQQYNVTTGSLYQTNKLEAKEGRQNLSHEISRSLTMTTLLMIMWFDLVVVVHARGRKLSLMLWHSILLVVTSSVSSYFPVIWNTKSIIWQFDLFPWVRSGSASLLSKEINPHVGIVLLEFI